MSVLEQAKPEVIDDTKLLTCVIVGTETISSHTEFCLRIQRGPLREDSWELRRRYNDFVTLHETLKIASAFELPLPPKKLLGNMGREFVAERQQGLQHLIDIILSNPMLACSDIVKKFLDIKNYNINHTESALQYVSIFLRTEPHWEVVEAIKEMGWRIRKSFFMLKPKDQPKQRSLLSWIEYGPDRLLSDKDQVSIIKLLKNIQHPSIFPIEHATANENGALAIKAFSKEGSIRDYLCRTRPNKIPYLKKYGSKKSYQVYSISEIRQYGRQILEVVKFLHDKGLAFHHLHSGNVIVEEKVCKIVDIENYMLGIPPYYKQFYSQFRKIHSSESIDVYSFGQLLYEMVYGRPLNQATIDTLPTNSPAEIRSVLESTLSMEACKMGLPTLEGLLSHPLFADETVITVGVKPQLKIPTKLKETFRNYKEQLERKLKEEQKMIGQVRRLSKAKAHHGSDSERRRRKLEARKKSMKKLNVVDENGTGKKDEAVTPVSPGPSSEPSTPVVTIPPPPALIPAPPVMSGVNDDDVTPPPPAVGGGRGALLGSIQSFKKGNLKKSATD